MKTKQKPNMKIKCDRCNKTLKELGGLIFSPPDDGKCRKMHLCMKCYGNFHLWSYKGQMKVYEKK